jgi:hypothetical protein
MRTTGCHEVSHKSYVCMCMYVCMCVGPCVCSRVVLRMREQVSDVLMFVQCVCVCVEYRLTCASSEQPSIPRATFTHKQQRFSNAKGSVHNDPSTHPLWKGMPTQRHQITSRYTCLRALVSIRLQTTSLQEDRG